MWRVRTISVCVFSVKSGSLQAARWRFQFWLSLSHWLCDLCTRYREVCDYLHDQNHESHRFLCLSPRLPPCTVPCRIVLASPDDLVTWSSRTSVVKNGILVATLVTFLAAHGSVLGLVGLVSVYCEWVR